jgi:uncharacterized protein YjiS (DUF1127 family)
MDRDAETGCMSCMLRPQRQRKSLEQVKQVTSPGTASALNPALNQAQEAEMKNPAAATPDVAATFPLPRAASVLYPVQAGLAWVAVAWTTRRRHTRELQYLCTMNDRDLRDLGLTRGDVRAIVGGYYQQN